MTAMHDAVKNFGNSNETKMLKNWSISNFKSFRDLQPIDLSMVNVLAGANSSGKSTIIQSILILKQTLQYGSADRPIVLNGPLLRMGSLQDVCNDLSLEKPIEIGFDFDLLPEEMESNGRPIWGKSSTYPFQLGNSIEWKEISTKLTFGIRESDLFTNTQSPGATLLPKLFRSHLSIQGNNDDEQHSQTWDVTYSPYSRWEYDLSVDDDSALEITINKPEADIEGVVVEHFLPDFAVVRYNHTVLEVSALVDAIFQPNTTLLGQARSFSDEVISPEAVAIVNQWLTKQNAESIQPRGINTMASEIQAKISRFTRPRNVGSLLHLTENMPHSMAEELSDLKENIKNTLLSERSVERRAIAGRSKGMAYATSYLADFFRYGVRYLGPLRDSPRPVYQPEALESTTDVGYRGEHTAAVFEINKRQRVTYTSPPNEDTDESYLDQATVTTNNLEYATAEWLEYLGVASLVETLDAGVFGNRLRVSIEEGEQLHDLTNVGVGVSQVLPIVVMSLLAPRGSLLIFEQPELHLHPRVQARLADFFLALAKDGKQTILETHSEYLVDRLRLRIASAPQDNVRSLVNILFSEKKFGLSSLIPLEISEYGAIVNWPKDFFEQSQRDVSRIIQAASRKRKHKSQKP